MNDLDDIACLETTFSPEVPFHDRPIDLNGDMIALQSEVPDQILYGVVGGNTGTPAVQKYLNFSSHMLLPIIARPCTVGSVPTSAQGRKEPATGLVTAFLTAGFCRVAVLSREPGLAGEACPARPGRRASRDTIAKNQISSFPRKTIGSSLNRLDNLVFAFNSQMKMSSCSSSRKRSCPSSNLGK